jgi:hypothetical protein
MGILKLLPAQHSPGPVERLHSGIALRCRGGDGHRWIVESMNDGLACIILDHVG